MIFISQEKSWEIFLQTIPLRGGPVCINKQQSNPVWTRSELGYEPWVCEQNVCISCHQYVLKPYFTMCVVTKINTLKSRNEKSRGSDPCLHNVEGFQQILRYPKGSVCKLQSPIHTALSPPCTTFSSCPTV